MSSDLRVVRMLVLDYRKSDYLAMDGKGQLYFVPIALFGETFVVGSIIGIVVGSKDRLELDKNRVWRFVQ